MEATFDLLIWVIQNTSDPNTLNGLSDLIYAYEGHELITREQADSLLHEITQARLKTYVGDHP